MEKSKGRVRNIFSRFGRTVAVNDMRDPLETRKARAMRYARKNRTEGKKARFPISE